MRCHYFSIYYLYFLQFYMTKKQKNELLAVNTVQMDMASLNLVKPEVDAHFNLYPVEVGYLFEVVANYSTSHGERFKLVDRLDRSGESSCLSHQKSITRSCTYLFMIMAVSFCLERFTVF